MHRVFKYTYFNLQPKSWQSFYFFYFNKWVISNSDETMVFANWARCACLNKELHKRPSSMAAVGDRQRRGEVLRDEEQDVETQSVGMICFDCVEVTNSVRKVHRGIRTYNTTKWEASGVKENNLWWQPCLLKNKCLHTNTNMFYTKCKCVIVKFSINMMKHTYLCVYASHRNIWSCKIYY